MPYGGQVRGRIIGGFWGKPKRFLKLDVGEGGNCGKIWQYKSNNWGETIFFHPKLALLLKWVHNSFPP